MVTTSSYIPIAQTAPLLKDTVVSVTTLPFTSAPPLSYLTARRETITASSVYYNPALPSLSQAAPVNYTVSLTITTLSESPLRLRHNGTSVDMEISIDNYAYIQPQPIVAAYSPNPSLDLTQNEAYYQRTTVEYIYSQIPVPPASGMVWDGRYSRCIDSKGQTLDSGSRLVSLRKQVTSILSSSTLSPMSVIFAGGLATTQKPPTQDRYALDYSLTLENFVLLNYTSSSLPPIPTGTVSQQITIYNKVSNPQETTGIYTLTESVVAALLNGDYFVDWVNLLVYTETPAPITPALTPQDTVCTILGYDGDNDEIVSIPSFSSTLSSSWAADDISLLNNGEYLE